MYKTLQHISWPNGSERQVFKWCGLCLTIIFQHDCLACTDGTVRFTKWLLLLVYSAAAHLNRMFLSPKSAL